MSDARMLRIPQPNIINSLDSHNRPGPTAYWRKKIKGGVGHRTPHLKTMQLHRVISLFILGHLARGHIPVKQPAFKSSSLSIKAVENETIFLPCVVENLGDSFIRWWKDDTLLSDSSIATMLTPQKITVLSDGMSIESVDPLDTGEYTCEMVRPKPWSSLKQIHKVDVLYPPKILPSPADGYLEVLLGERVRMDCSARGMPPPRVSWRTKVRTRTTFMPFNVAIVPVKGFVMTSSEKSAQMLEFIATSHLMAGIYQCEADNGIGNPVHTNFLLKILHKPEVISEKAWVHSAPGIKTSLTCRILSNPEARVEWLYNGDVLKLSPPRVTYQARGDNHVLQFNSVTASDFGNYTCRAANRLGESQAFMQLSGTANPVVFKKVEGKSGEEFSLIWEVDSISPIFDYKLLFRKEGNNQWASFIIPADSSSTGPLHSKSYTFTGLDKLSAYEAKIFARNRFGWSNSSEIVTFGFIKSTYTEEGGITNRVVTVSESTNSARSFVDSSTLIFALCTIKFFLNIYDIS